MDTSQIPAAPHSPMRCPARPAFASAERQAESTNELARLVHSVGFSWPEAREVMLAGAEAAFLPDGKKQAFLSSYAQRLEEAWENCQYLQDS